VTRTTSRPIGRSETFHTDQALPQVPELNRHRWKGLESLIRKTVEGEHGRAVIVSGGLFIDEQGHPLREDQIQWIEVKGQKREAIPPFDYKVVIEQDKAGNVKAYAYILANRDESGNEAELKTILKSARVPVGRVEKLLGGADFLPGFPEDVKKKLKADPNAVETQFAKDKIQVISMLNFRPVDPTSALG
jgi:DNA/RNA endonuclease G (NUC1)